MSLIKLLEVSTQNAHWEDGDEMNKCNLHSNYLIGYWHEQHNMVYDLGICQLYYVTPWTRQEYPFIIHTFMLNFGNLGGVIRTMNPMCIIDCSSQEYSHQACASHHYSLTNNIHSNIVIENTHIIHNILPIQTDPIHYSYRSQLP